MWVLTGHEDTSGLLNIRLAQLTFSGTDLGLPFLLVEFLLTHSFDSSESMGGCMI